MIGNTLTACWWMASGFVTYYSIIVLFATHLQVDLHMSPAAIGEVGVAANLVTFPFSAAWGWLADKIGRRASMIIPALIAIPLAPMYLLTNDFSLIWWGFVLQGAPGSGGMQGQMATYLNERFPTEVRHGERILLSPGGNLGRPRGADHHLLCHRLAARLRDPDDDRDHDLRAQLHNCAAGRTGDQGQRARGGSRGCLSSIEVILAGIDAGHN
jgi:hypothetical protein